MSAFTTPLILKMLPNERFEVAQAFTYHIGELGSGNIINVPKGFVTDLTSVPRLLWPVLPPHGFYGKAAVLHDYLYVNGLKTKAIADNIFLEAMTVLNIPKYKRIIMYKGVHYFGRGNYTQ